MKIAILTINFFIFFHFTYAQTGFHDQKVNIDSNMTVWFPSQPKEVKAHGMRAYSSIIDSVYYQALVNDSMLLKAPTERLFKITLEGLKDGFLKNKQYENFSNIAIDTALGGTKGKLIVMQNTMADNMPKMVYNFITLQNNHYYGAAVSVYSLESTETNDKIKAFFNAVQFKGQNFTNTSKTKID